MIDREKFIDEINIKTCSSCNQERQLSLFGKSNKMKNNLTQQNFYNLVNKIYKSSIKGEI